MRQILYLIGISFVASFFFTEPKMETFGLAQEKGELQDDELNEVSGLTASSVNPGYFWVHNDSGDQARIFLLDSTAKRQATYYLEGVQAEDWEDIGSIQRNGKSYLLIGDIGDNLGRRATVRVHLVEEPKWDTTAAMIDTIPKAKIITYTLQYEDGPRDAESLFFDPQDQKLYMLSKRELHVGVYNTDLPEHGREELLLRRRTSLPYTFLTGADISADGEEVLIKNLLHVYYWKRKAGESLVELFNRPGEMEAYEPEAQGEAIAFAPNGSGYYTISERPLGLPSYLYFYPRR